MKKTITILLSIVITSILLWVLLAKTSLQDIVEALTTISLTDIILMLILYIIVQYLRSIRTWILIQKSLPIRQVFSITCTHVALTNIMPARTGEIGYVYLLKKTGVINTGTGIGTLAIARIFDSIAIALLFFGATIITPTLPTIAQQIKIPTLIAISIIIAILIISVFSTNTLLLLLQKITRILSIENKKIIQWIIKRISETLQSIQILNSKKNIAYILFSSIGIWISLFLINFIIFKNISPIPITLAILASSITAILSGIPIQGIAGLGTTEAYWTIALVGVGVGTTTAIIAGFSQHIIGVVYSTIFGIYGILTLQKQKKIEQEKVKQHGNN